MNLYAIRAIYMFEMARTWRTLMQSIVSPVLSTSLYFIVFGAAVGSRIAQIDGVSYGAFIVPGLIMLQILTQSLTKSPVSNKRRCLARKRTVIIMFCFCKASSSE